jgi:hypothetical protein
MIFWRHDGHRQSGESPNFASSLAPSTKFLFDTSVRLRKSAIAVTHSKKTTDFLFDTNERHKKTAIVVTHSKSTGADISIRYKWKLHGTPPLAKKIANPAPRIPLA